MAQVIWTEPALSDLDAIADYIAIENPVVFVLFVMCSEQLLRTGALKSREEAESACHSLQSQHP